MPSMLFSSRVFGLLELRQRQRNNDIIGQRVWSIMKRNSGGWVRGSPRKKPLMIFRNLSDLLDVTLFADENNLSFCGLFVLTTLLHSCGGSYLIIILTLVGSTYPNQP